MFHCPSFSKKGTTDTSGLNYNKIDSQMIVAGLKIKMYKWIERVLFYDLPTHKQPTAVLLLPP